MLMRIWPVYRFSLVAPAILLWGRRFHLQLTVAPAIWSPADYVAVSAPRVIASTERLFRGRSDHESVPAARASGFRNSSFVRPMPSIGCDAGIAEYPAAPRQ